MGNRWKGRYKGRSSARSAKKAGYDFEDETIKAFSWLSLQYPLFFHKEADTHALRTVIRQIKGAFYDLPPSIQDNFQYALYAFNRMTLPKQPGDMWLVVNGIGGMLELKSKSASTPLMLSTMIQPHQFQYATKIEVNGGGFYYFLICNRLKPDSHYVIALTRSEVRDIFIAEAEMKKRKGWSRSGWSWDELASFTHLPVMVANNRRYWKEDHFTKWDYTPLILDILKIYGKEVKECQGQESYVKVRNAFIQNETSV